MKTTLSIDLKKIPIQLNELHHFQDIHFDASTKTLHLPVEVILRPKE